MNHKAITLTLLFIVSFNYNYCQTNEFNHPRGLIHSEEVENLQSRIQTEPYQSMFETLKDQVTGLLEVRQKNNVDIYKEISLTTNLSYLYTLSGETHYAGQAYDVARHIITTYKYISDEISRGLTRATVVLNLAVTYDLCYSALSKAQRQFLLDALYKGMMTISSNMGYSANYALESNWMGVRYATVLFTALVWDETDLDQKRSRALPYIWDAQKRLADHIEANIHPQGWNAESLGYHGYNWSFIAPAIIALQNHSDHEAFRLKNYAPHALGALHALATSSVPIETRPGNYGVKPDFSDDNLNTGMYLYACGQRIYPESQLPAIKWMYDYFFDTGIPGQSNDLFYHIAYDQPFLTPENPQKMGWDHFVDTTQGVMVMRNQFYNHQDIIFAFNTTAIRVKGHQGFDNLGIRLIGLDNIWIVGAGRTGEIAGQSTLFPKRDIQSMKGEKGATGKLIDYQVTRDGGFAICSGSCMHVKNHVRQVEIEYHPEIDVHALLKIKDTSENGRIWRINTPEFNKVTILKDGFFVKAPNGTSMRGYVTNGPEKINISTEKVRYGGSTTRHNPGICFHGNCHEHTIAIDVACEGNITVVLTLQEKGKGHPLLEEVKR